MATVAKSIHSPLVVAASYLAHPARTVAGDLAYLLGSPSLTQQPHDLMMRAFHRIAGLPVAVLQLFRSRMRRQLYSLWHMYSLQPDSVSESVLLTWRKEYEERGEAAFTEKQPSGEEALEARIAELERFCGQLSLENRTLKKSLKSMQSPRGTP